MGGSMRRLSMLASMAMFAVGFGGWSAGSGAVQYPTHGYQPSNGRYRRKGKTSFQYRVDEMRKRKAAEVTQKNAQRAYNRMEAK